MRFEGDGRSHRAPRSGSFHHAAQQRLVSEMNAVKVADCHHTGVER
jgi:hypothetical protein